VVFRESRVVDEVWGRVAPRALAGEALLIVLDNFEHAVMVASHAAWNGPTTSSQTCYAVSEYVFLTMLPSHGRRIVSRGACRDNHDMIGLRGRAARLSDRLSPTVSGPTMSGSPRRASAQREVAG
jgi:hypothetical protein